MRPNGPTMQRIFRAVPAALVLAGVVLSGTARAETVALSCNSYIRTLIIDETRSSIVEVNNYGTYGPYAARIDASAIAWNDGADHTPRKTTYFTLSRLSGDLQIIYHTYTLHFHCVPTNAPQPKF